MPTALLVGIVLAALVMLLPFWPWLLLAAWVGAYGRRWLPVMTRLTGRRKRAAALLTALLLALIVVPTGLLMTSLVIDAIAYARHLLDSAEVQRFLHELVEAPSGGQRGGKPMELLTGVGGSAWALASAVTSAVTRAIVGILLFITGVYAILVDGDAAYRWLERHAPIEPKVLRRLAVAFLEVGRGLLFGVVGAGLLQAIAGTAAYVALGVPQPLILGALTLVASLVPAIGTGFVWVPVAIGLALDGRTEAALVMGAVGVFVISTVDNLIRPWLAQRADLGLPSYVIMVSMFGGIAVVGPAGLMLGPLLVRLAREALELQRERRSPVQPG